MNTYFKLYVCDQNPNGTSDLIITDSNDQVIDCLPELVFGAIEAKRFGWLGDSLGNIDICYYGESIGMLDYSDEADIGQAIQGGECSSLFQVMEVEYQSVLDCLAISPVHSRLAQLKKLNNVLRTIK